MYYVSKGDITCGLYENAKGQIATAPYMRRLLERWDASDLMTFVISLKEKGWKIIELKERRKG